MTYCVHCDLDVARRRNGLCDACNAYIHKMGQLPSPRVLHRRLLRREAQRWLTA